MISFLLIVTIVFVLQFLLFRYTKLYNLNLLFGLYKNKLSKPSKAKILILGTSHGKSHIIPKEIALSNNIQEEDILNLSKVSASSFELYHTYIANKHLLKDVTDVYITITPHMYCEKFYPYYKYELIFLKYTQWKYLIKTHKKYLKDTHNIKYNYFFLPILIFFKSLKYTNNELGTFRGYEARNYNQKKLNRFNKKNIAKYFITPEELFKPSIFLINQLKKLQDELIKDKINVYYILTPTYKNFASSYKDELKNYDSLLVHQLNKTLGKTILLGSMYDNHFNLKEYDFYDDTHLSHSGAVKFTRTIYDDISSHPKSTKKDIISFCTAVSSKTLIVKNNTNFHIQFQEVVKIVKNMTVKGRLILYGNSNFAKFLELSVEKNFVIIDKNIVNSLDILNTLTNNDTIIITAIGYEDTIKKMLKDNYNFHNIVLFEHNNKIDLKYFRVQINALFSIITFLQKRYTSIYLYSQSSIYNDFFAKIFHTQNLNLSIPYLKKDKILITDIGNESKLYDILLDNNVKKDNILYFTL